MFITDFSGHYGQGTGQYLYLFLQKAALLKYLNYQHAQILIGMREIIRALFLTVLYFSFCIYTFGYCYLPIYPINREA